MAIRIKIWILSIGVLLASVLFFSCSNDFQEIIEAVDYKTYPIQTAQNIEIVQTDSGKITFKVFAPVLERFTQLENNPYELFPNGIKVVTYSIYPKVESYLTCNYAKHDINAKLWEARDNVVAVNIDGDTVKSEQIFWDLNTEKIYSDKYVNITTATEIIYGTGFVANQNFLNWKITNVKGNIYLDE